VRNNEFVFVINFADNIVMSLSVVIPAHNEAKYIGVCLRAIAAQTQPPDEVILVDNNSKDDTIALAQNVGLKQLRIIHESKQGIGHARTAGFNAAKCSIIGRIDADTILPPSWCKQVTSAFTDKKLDAITGPAEFYDFHQIVRPTITRLHTRLYFHRTEQMMGSPTLWGSNMAITRAMWQQVRAEVTDDDSLIHEDVDLAIQIYKAGGRILFDPKLTVAVKMRQLYRSPRSTYRYFKRRRSTIEHSK